MLGKYLVFIVGRAGQSWALRSNLAEWGVHRSLTHTVYGVTLKGAISMVLSYGIKENTDARYEFTIIGIGGGGRLRHYSFWLGSQVKSDSNKVQP